MAVVTEAALAKKINDYKMHSMLGIEGNTEVQHTRGRGGVRSEVQRTLPLGTSFLFSCIPHLHSGLQQPRSEKSGF